MMGIKGRFLKKLKSIKPLGALKQGRVLLVRAADGLLDPYPYPSPPHLHNSNGFFQSSPKCKEMEPEVIDVSELMRDLEDQEMGFVDNVGNKENVGPKVVKVKDPSTSDKENVEVSSLSDSGSFSSYSYRSSPLVELHVSSFQEPDSTPTTPSIEDLGVGDSHKFNLENTQSLKFDELGFRKPKLNSTTLFDPDLLAAFQEAASEHMRAQEVIRRGRIEEKLVGKDDEPPPKTRRIEECPLSKFDEKCPPGGSDSVVLYTTSLRGIRKTFEDCNRIIFLLESFRVRFVERDVSMHLEFREEMWRVLGGRVVPPRLFVKGRYVGGADEVVGLHEQGQLLELFEGIPRDQSTSLCDGCGGMRFVLCANCNGSRKLRVDEGEGIGDLFIQCPECNEHGLIVCTICC